MKLDTVNKIKKAASFIAFMVIICFVFSKVTWVFRYNSEAARQNIVGMNNIEDGTLDVILYGSSDIYTYFSPMQAFNDYGFTSYDYGTGEATVAKLEVMKYYIEESRKTQDPKLYIIGLRPLTMIDVDSDKIEKAIRNWTDSVDIASLTRLKSIFKYYLEGDIPHFDMLPVYIFDIAKYHTYFEGPKNPEYWHRTADSLNKGFVPRFLHVEGTPAETKEKGKLSDKQMDALNALMDYCSEEKLAVLFVLSPYLITEEEMAFYIAAEEIITSRGFKYLDLTDCIDYETDMSDESHVNYLGAVKYTDTLGRYISENYELPDHRGESGYESWNEEYLEYAVMAERYRAKVTKELEK